MTIAMPVLRSVMLPLELLGAVLLFTRYFRRRDHFAFRMAAGTAMLLLPELLTFLLMLIMRGQPAEMSNIAPSLAIRLFYSALSYILTAAFIFLICDIEIREAFYGAACAYLMQHFVYSLYALFQFFVLHSVELGSIRQLFFFSVLYFAVYLFNVRRTERAETIVISPNYVLGTVTATLAVTLCLSSLCQEYQSLDNQIYPLFLACDAACCFFILLNQYTRNKELRYRAELDAQHELWLRSRAQYEMSRENTELINRKCHDLKHQIAALKHLSGEERNESIADLERSVMIYDSFVKTENAILDAVLTEKNLICEDRDITMTCVADGACLSFMDTVDVYTIFGNAIDNAIESVSRFSDPDERAISVMVFSRAGLVVIQIENRTKEMAELNGELPATSKKTDPGYHGFGLKSIKYTAEKYGGFISVEQTGGVFLLRVTIPQNPVCITN